MHFDGMERDQTRIPARLSGDMFGMKKESDGVGWAIIVIVITLAIVYFFYPRPVPQGGQNAI